MELIKLTLHNNSYLPAATWSSSASPVGHKSSAQANKISIAGSGTPRRPETYYPHVFRRAVLLHFSLFLAFIRFVVQRYETRG